MPATVTFANFKTPPGTFTLEHVGSLWHVLDAVVGEVKRAVGGLWSC